MSIFRWIGRLLSALALVTSFLSTSSAPLAASLDSMNAASVSTATLAPQSGARAAIVVEYPSGRILYQKNAHARLAQASTTKITTAILALEYGKLNDQVVVSPQDL